MKHSATAHSQPVETSHRRYRQRALRVEVSLGAFGALVMQNPHPRIRNTETPKEPTRPRSTVRALTWGPRNVKFTKRSQT